jgi:hypothetical protein
MEARASSYGSGCSAKAPPLGYSFVFT